MNKTSFTKNAKQNVSGVGLAIPRSWMNEVWLAGFSGGVLMTLLALQVTLSIHLAYLSETELSEATEDGVLTSFNTRGLRTGGPLAAAWAVCFFIYMAYALLPIRLRYACIAGVVFSVVHVVVAYLLYPLDYPTMMAHVSTRLSCMPSINSYIYVSCSLTLLKDKRKL